MGLVSEMHASFQKLAHRKFWQRHLQILLRFFRRGEGNQSGRKTRAITEAVLAVKREGAVIEPEIMVPLVGHASEMRAARDLIEAEIAAVCDEQGVDVDELTIPIGTMIETPRAALTADEIAEHADFFSFGTNDLTQTTMAISRDDAEAGYHRVLAACDPRIARAVRDAAQVGKYYSFPGVAGYLRRSWGPGWAFIPQFPPHRDEVAFTREVLDDAERRFNIDRGRVLISGDSIGGSITSYLACWSPDLAAAFAPHRPLDVSAPIATDDDGDGVVDAHLATDQRGETRVSGCDVGAYELPSP